VPIASVAKLMTAYVILQDHPLSAGASGPDITVQPSEAAAYPAQSRDGDALVPVAAGEAISERRALEALLLPSADNMARILARWTGTSYTDASGLDSSSTSTAARQDHPAERTASRLQPRARPGPRPRRWQAVRIAS
jgi:serine-type D-Ala-D-Ala carboxypeptidase (penicillin-binding protein 5/6)